MPRGLILATPQLTPDGTLFSARYDDVYHSTEGGLAQAHHVFLGGNGLPGGWQGKRSFTIVETGFGQGLNFLATWAAWRDDPQRCGRLDFVSVEKHPFDRAGLALVHPQEGALASLAEALRQAWPVPVPGVHRLVFDAGRVTLTLMLGDAETLLPQLSCAADAFYLDGFSPAKNPDLWQPGVFKQLARIARGGATLATYTAAGAVRHGLREAGFEVRKAPGFGRKRDMTVAAFPTHWRTRRGPAEAPVWPERHAIVLGAGLAGCSVAERLAARGWRITLIDEHEAPAGGTSAHRAAAMHPHVSIDDSMLSRLSRAGNLLARRHWEALDRAGFATGFHPAGVLQLAEHADDAAEQQRIVQALGFPADFIAWLDAARAADRVGAGVPQGGWWFAQAGWVAPPDICRAALAAAGEAVELRWRTRIESLLRHDVGWQACDAQGNVIARAPVVVLANSLDAVRLAPLASAALKPVRGQLTDVPVAALEDGVPWPRAVVCGDGYLLPREPGAPAVRVGSSFQPGEADPDARTADHAANLRRLAGLQPAHAAALARVDPARLLGYVGVRCVSANRLPLIGAVADEAAIMAPGFRLRGPHAALPRVPGLYAALAYGSRGLTWSVLGAELLAAQIDGGPLPLESELAAALDPGRFLMRALRHGKHAA
ncbi:bifunctional tRNA (5-methylaminomethyl-2-thiouridine)(34)-methyltransferase MnmD/FAD-dependent 5-carboxymethylaminomethyl-2-thiouridine(34) oxidoreductase MnmC [Ralstonia nicotianae]|uniref:bifunctional tRNA (5-methylaminomethyl-2-thiouridine)(34)-methyltransferase MnmD/FAD-dependent 5-carboxymethylaminomethyl-2-thiouridine(34) oxidoreductase MnmC n=3 Tax=Ralstonia pseudosolanacearum TaxID=1310165 RepID=UPI0002C0F9EA|nr:MULTISPECIES: bifunctional tRNA (5-methylaminomethyl-2-thiouridine)(34)-methyltransferase MnmD/FAD-dependent 5-carboxymethylaminomethyl-2-thiouridine(34) oxidoreductase MnmC [Ralstonia]ANH32999.1 5-methylaminomethyl-2-thiouridine-forming enzyme mnmC [Ralstonia solanacearum]APF86989.1 bifunctional tRNA (5-methylaminomethyl-2-thiouridylate)-methyltransferase MnmD/FAD-dependent cmnm(5)s(2)U34 oxidoreductase MnmC [Ralstonia solanacearum FJAT-1458]ARS56238.1 bifunctional tRNA (5-methylaminomethyl-